MSRQRRVANGDVPPPTRTAEVHFPPSESLMRLVDELERWGELFLRLAREDRGPAAEQVLGGLVDWMGNGLMEGWLHLPIPLFEEVSNLAEEVLQAFQAYLACVQKAPRPCSAEERASHEALIRAILARARGLTLPDPQSPATNR